VVYPVLDFITNDLKTRFEAADTIILTYFELPELR